MNTLVKVPFTNQNEKLIQQKCAIEYYPKLDPDPDILDAGNYILLGNFPLPWNYFCEQKDEIPTPISGSSYVIIKKRYVCQCSLSAGSWYLEANIAYCTEDPDNPSTQLTLYYTVNMATVIYQFQEKLKTEGITDLTLFTEQIPFDAKEPDLIVEEDTYVLQDTSPAVNYKEVMEDFAMRCYLSKPDLAMSMAEPSHWFGGHNSWLTFVGVAAVLVVVLIPFLLFTLCKYCGFRFQFQKVNSILEKLLILNKTSESIPPTLAQPMTEFGEMTFEMFDLKILQLVLIVMASTLTCYLLIRMILWLFDYLNTKFLNINSTGLTYLSSLTMDKTNIYLQFSDFTTGECTNLYLGTIFGNPEDIYVCVAEAIATHREAKLVFMQGLVKRILRESYREPTNPPSAGTPLAQSVFAGIPSPSRGPSPCFVTHPNYYNGQFHHYYPSENPIAISQSPTTSAHTSSSHSAGMNASQTSVTSTSSSTSTTPSAMVHCSSHTVPTVAREAHRTYTVFAPITLVESLTKTNHLLVPDMKGELKSMNNQLSTQSTENLKTRMEALEQGFIELREVVMQRTINNLKPNPELLEVWDPTMMVHQKSNWTKNRLILNKVAEDNCPDLFPSEWDHQKLFTQMHEMHYKVFSEVMTTMFHQCGILMDCNIFEMQNYKLFLKALHYHLVMGTVNMTQVGHFLILMTYMSFCRLNHYTDYLFDRE